MPRSGMVFWCLGLILGIITMDLEIVLLVMFNLLRACEGRFFVTSFFYVTGNTKEMEKFGMLCHFTTAWWVLTRTIGKLLTLSYTLHLEAIPVQPHKPPATHPKGLAFQKIPKLFNWSVESPILLTTLFSNWKPVGNPYEDKDSNGRANMDLPSSYSSREMDKYGR